MGRVGEWGMGSPNGVSRVVSVSSTHAINHFPLSQVASEAEALGSFTERQYGAHEIAG